MRFGKVVIENFQAISHIEINLDNKGLVLIQGENKDDSSQNSNGSGKSSIPDAVHWALYNETARGQSGDDIVNDTIGKNTRVSIQIFDDNGEEYLVARHRKHKPGKNSLTVMRRDGSGELVDISKGTDSLTQGLLLEIIGCSEYVFCNSAYCAQESMPDIPGMTDKSLKSLVEESAGISKVQLAFDIATSNLKLAKTRSAEVAGRLAVAASSLAHWQESIEMYGKSAENWRLNQNSRIKEAKAEVERAELACSDARGKVESYPIDEIRSQLATVTAAIDGVEKEKEELNRLTKQETAAQNAYSSARFTASNQKMILINAADEYKMVEARVGAPCKECGKPYQETDIAAAKGLAAQKVVDAKSKLSALEQTHKSALEAYEKARDERVRFESSMTDISENLSRARDLAEKCHVFDKLKDNLKANEQTLAANKASVAKLKAEICPIDSQLTEAVAKRDAVHSQVEKLRAEEVAAANEEMICREVATVFSPSGVRAHILDTITPFLNSRTAHYLGILTDGNIEAIWSTVSLTKSGEPVEKFAVDVVSKVGSKRYKGLSGGERRKVRLACQMALQDLVSSRATKPLQLFMADEIDDAVDESGLERLMAILEEKARERGTVLVISHNSLSDWIREVVTVVKSGGQSVLVGSALQ